ncbi:orf4 [Alcelaphine gammaherpesvirus 2]|uniref:Orf4 n=1 Tax=Alcelaphine gammaherpesvirus 2 TaxID=138184 RepID=A0A068AAJ4_9GAMA|nr:orf4 [Alcelaphine gammaherpesvirus 2]AIA62046.1 orf4 [Alcelaphine gammaherpesvirus 2]
MYIPSRASGLEESAGKADPASTQAPMAASEVMQDSLEPRPLPSLSQVKPIYEELSGLSNTIRKVLASVVDPTEPLVLTVTECIMVKKVKQCIRINFVSFMSCTLRLPRVQDDAKRTDVLMEIITEFHREGETSLKKMYIALAFSCIYLCYLIEGCEINVDLISHLLARYYLRYHLRWLIGIRGLSGAVKREHPKLWFAVNTRRIFNCGTLSK